MEDMCSQAEGGGEGRGGKVKVTLRVKYAMTLL